MGICKGCNGHLYGCQFEDNDVTFCDDKDVTNMMTNNAYKHGYDAGYNQCELDWQKKLNEKEERFRWHDLRKNPKDLPKKTTWYCIKVKSSDDYRMVYACGKEFKDKADAWREIEPFEGEVG